MAASTSQLTSGRLCMAGIGAATASYAAYAGYRKFTAAPHPPVSPPVAPGKTRICVAGFTTCPETGHAHYLANTLAKSFPDKYETWYYFDNYEYYPFVKEKFKQVEFPEELKGHNTSPFVWCGWRAGPS